MNGPDAEEARSSEEGSTWEGADPKESTQRPVGSRTVEDYERPAALGTDSAPTPLPADFDFEDVGPTEVTHEMGDGPLADLPMYEPLRAGETLGRYRIERLLGRGATGAVYEASHTVVGRRVALKVLFPHMAVVPTQVQRLFREARIAATVEHPNVVTVFDGGRDRETYYLAMELLEGRTLGELLALGRLPVRTVVDIMRQVMDGVAAVHDEGVVHRDLKPDNIFMQMKPDDPLHPGIPKVLDFGVSKLYEQGGRPATKLTAMGMVMGTPYYMAPEQVADTSGVDQRADVYSLGVILYEAITGKLPYEGSSVVEIFTQAHEGVVTPVRELRPEVPPSLEALIAKAMCPDKDARFQDMHEMRAALEAVSFDGDEDAEAWSDRSQPWMLDKKSGVRRGDGASTEPLSVEPTLAMSQTPVLPRSMPTPLTNPRPPDVAPLTAAAGGRGLPTWAWVLLAAAGGGLLALISVIVLVALSG